MVFKSGNFKTIIVFVVILVICVIVITVSFKQSEVFDNLKTGALDIFKPVQEGVFRFFNPIAGFFAGIKNYINTAEKIETLQQENAALLNSYSENINLKIENDALRKLLDMEMRKDMDSIPAKVIGYYNNKWQSEILINTGRSSGVLKGMAVVDSRGLVGLVISSANSTSRVRLLDDPQSSIGARILSTRSLGIIEGNLNNTVYLNYIKTDEDVFRGDVLITSELGENMPSEILIGRISRVSINPANPYKEITVDPFADFRKLEYVLVIKGSR
jgi:rod shape-determining protein MreC